MIHPTLVESKNAEKINVENTGEIFLALAFTLTHRSPPTPSFLFSTFFLSTKLGFTHIHCCLECHYLIDIITRVTIFNLCRDEFNAIASGKLNVKEMI